MKKVVFILTVLFFVPNFIFSQSWKKYPYSPSGSQISFPADEGRHHKESVEWWYTSGHLTGETTGKHYSYMLSYFYYPVASVEGFRILNISDDDKGIFYDDTQLLSYDSLATDKLDIKAVKLDGSKELWRNKYKGTNILPFEYVIDAETGYVALNMEYKVNKRPLLIGKDGYLKLGYDNYTYYYSLTGVEVTGTIKFNNKTEKVRGTSWIERQYGNLNPVNGVEYEWFSIQLSNQMDLNLWNIFTPEGKIPEDKRFKVMAVYKNDKEQYTISDFKIERLKYGYTQDKQKCYAQEWRLTSKINHVDLIISTLHSGSEVRSPFRFYEGSTQITGTVNGKKVKGVGFVELLHSYKKPELKILNNKNWNRTIPLQWEVSNPDDGNPLSYKLEYRTENQKTFQTVTSDITKSNFKWDTSLFPEGTVFQLKITGKSIDGTITGSATKEFIYHTGAVK